MCGIAGIIDRKGIDLNIMYRMSAVIRHRGPDDEGFLTVDANRNFYLNRGDDSITEVQALSHITSRFTEQKINVALLHRRLSIIDLSAHGHQPMNYNDHKSYIVFNGEVYNYREIRTELTLKGYSFFSDSDTEVILASYQEWGVDCVKKFMGMWSFAIYDHEKNIVFISRDRFGIKPLYYFYKNGKLVFASEIKALLQDSEIPAVLNQEVAYQYISFSKANDPYSTLFKDINELPVAHNMVINLNDATFKISCYYHLDEAITSTTASVTKNYFEEYLFRFRESINMHLRADVPIGTCLSGGLDSSAIIGFAAPQLSNTTFNSFTAIYDDKKIDESYFANQVVSHFKNIKPFYTKPNFTSYWNDLDKLIWHQDLPIASTSMYAQWEVMKLAGQQGMKVLLDGQGADETLGGYSVFSGVYLFSLLKKLRLIKFYSEQKSLKKNRGVNITNEILRSAFYLVPASLKKSVRDQKRVGSTFLDNDFVNNHYHIRDKGVIGKNYRDMSIVSTKYGMHDLLRYEDRNSMAFSIESRVPFLDHRLVELSIAMPDDVKIHKGWTKYVLRKTIDKKVPDSVVWRTDKKGFVTPQKNWINDLNPQLTAYLNEINIPSILNKENILKSLNGTLDNASKVSEFWKMIAFIKWCEVYKVKI